MPARLLPAIFCLVGPNLSTHHHRFLHFRHTDPCRGNHAHLRQKVGLLVMGLFVCLISVLRAIWLNNLLYPPDTASDLVSIANWSVAEVNLVIVCACLTPLKQLLRQFFGPVVHRFPSTASVLGRRSRRAAQGNWIDASEVR
ncbi:hypothetical protein VTK56DRAFT_5482 [Thermocarpiscus australiensis]